MVDHENPWLGTKEAADHIGVTPRILYRFIDAGDIPAYKLGRVLRVRRNDLDAYLETVRVEPGVLRHLYPPPKLGAPAESIVDEP